MYLTVKVQLNVFVSIGNAVQASKCDTKTTTLLIKSSVQLLSSYVRHVPVSQLVPVYPVLQIQRYVLDDVTHESLF